MNYRALAAIISKSYRYTVSVASVNAVRPAWIDPDDVTFTSTSTLEITTGGTYSGLRIRVGDGQNCVDVKTGDVVIFEDCVFSWTDGKGVFAPGGLVTGYGSDPKVEIYNSVFLGRHPLTLGRQVGRSIDYGAGSRLIVENSHFQRGAIYAYQHRADVDDVLRLRYNVALNIDARLVDASGAPTTTIGSYRQFFQHNGRSGIAGDFEVAWNEVWNEPDDSGMEDAINLFRTGGTASNLVHIHHNLINGAYPTTSTSTNYSGGGIMLSDGSGDPAYGLAEYNVVLASANYGMAITAGNHFTIDNNRIFRTGTWPDGTTDGQANTGPGWYVHDYGSTTVWGDHTVTNNVVRWQNYPTGTNNSWAPSPGTNFTNTGNTSYGTEIDQAFIDAEVIAYREGAQAAGVTIGHNLDVSSTPVVVPTTLLGVASDSTSLTDYPKTDPATTGDIWVDPNAGTNGSGSQVSPYNNLGSALSSVSDGERIIVREGTLSPSTRFNRSTNWGTGIEVFAYGTERFTLDCTNLGTGSASRILSMTGSNEHWKGFEIINAKSSSQALYIEGSNNHIEDIWVHHCLGDGIYLANWGSGTTGNIIQDFAIWRLGDGSTQDTNVPDAIVATGGTSTPTLSSVFVRGFVANGPDDNVDLYRSRGARIIDVVSYGGGYYWNGNAGGTSSGDGNGFKMGGGDSDAGNNFAIGCLALACRANGFSHNEAANTSGTNPNIVFAFVTSVDNGSYGIDAGGDATNHKNVARDAILLGNGNTTYVGANAVELRVSTTDPTFANTTLFDYSLDTGSNGIDAGIEGGISNTVATQPTSGTATNRGASTVALEIAKEWLAKDLT